MTPKRVGKQCDRSGGAKKLRETWVESSRTYLVFALPLLSCRFNISLRLFTERPNQATYFLEPTFESPWSPICKFYTHFVPSFYFKQQDTGHVWYSQSFWWGLDHKMVCVSKDLILLLFSHVITYQWPFFWSDKKRNTIRYHQRTRQFLWSSLLYPLFLWMYIFDPLWFVLLRYCTTNILAILRVLTTGGNSVLTRAKNSLCPHIQGTLLTNRTLIFMKRNTTNLPTTAV